MELFSHHTHSYFCDGKLSPEEYIRKAIELEISGLGFSSHAPFDDSIVWAMNDDHIEKYVFEIDMLKKKYEDKIEIYRSLEIDYIPKLTKSFSYWKDRAKLDYTVGSVHMVKDQSLDQMMFLDGPDNNFTKGLEVVFYGDIKKAVRSYYYQINEMLENEKPDIVGHIDKIKMNNKNRYFREDEKWYRNLQKETLKLLQETNTIVEVNTRGIYKQKSKEFFPDSYFLTECYQHKIPVTISTDAHHPNELLLEFKNVYEKLKRIGFREITRFTKEGWVQCSLL